ncbi:MAG TPA: hypothetical protein VF756_23920 [Thermoanaerobaculia bacterium]
MFLRGPSEHEQRITAHLRPLRTACAVLAGAVGLCVVLSWLLVEGLGIRFNQGVPDAVPIVLTAVAMVLILLSSRLRTTILRGSIPRNPAIPIDVEKVLRAYRKATLASFATLVAASLLGLLIALLSGIAFYGIFLCIAAAFAMFTRWPRLVDADRISRGLRSP